MCYWLLVLPFLHPLVSMLCFSPLQSCIVSVVFTVLSPFSRPVLFFNPSVSSFCGFCVLSLAFRALTAGLACFSSCPFALPSYLLFLPSRLPPYSSCFDSIPSCLSPYSLSIPPYPSYCSSLSCVVFHLYVLSFSFKNVNSS
jgi:hypothetical protein